MRADDVILLVDDDAVSRRVLEQTLVGAGLTVVTLSSGEAALRWLEGQAPIVVLLDLIMPGIDGYAVLRHMRTRPHLEEVPVVVLTALDSEEEIERITALLQTEPALTDQLNARWLAVKLLENDEDVQEKLTQTVSDPSTINAAVAQAGKTLFEANCSACHFHNTKDNKVGPGLLGLFKNPKLPDSGQPTSEKAVREKIINGGIKMPPFKHLKEKEISDIVDYLKSL